MGISFAADVELKVVFSVKIAVSLLTCGVFGWIMGSWFDYRCTLSWLSKKLAGLTMRLGVTGS